MEGVKLIKASVAFAFFVLIRSDSTIEVSKEPQSWYVEWGVPQSVEINIIIIIIIVITKNNLDHK